VKLVTSIFATAALTTSSLMAYAQENTSAHILPDKTIVTSYDRVPEGFDPVSASDSQLQDYGFPRRPDLADTKAYAKWQQAVSVERITPEIVVHPGVFHRPNRVVSKSAAIDNTALLHSGNWSGYALSRGSPYFDEVVGTWIVPSINNQYASFTGFGSEWVGLDGDCSCSDLVQDGTSMNWIGGKPTYFAWFESIPEPEMEIANFAVSPGDVIYAYSAFGVKNGVETGYYYLANYNTRKGFSTTLPLPKGIAYHGASAEWIMERAQVNGSFNNPPPDYAYAYMDDAFAYRAGSNRAIAYTSEANQNIVMVQGSTSLSKSYEQDSDSLWFQWLAY
jgi:hypothetical protein